MRQVLIPLAAIVLLCIPQATQSQDLQLRERAEVLSAALIHRMEWERDSSTLHACSVYMALDSVADFLQMLDEKVRPLVYVPVGTDPCARGAPVAVRNAQALRLGPVRRGRADTVEVQLEVLRGEQFYRGLYKVIRLPGGVPLVVRVERHSFMQVLPARRAPPPT